MRRQKLAMVVPAMAVLAMVGLGVPSGVTSGAQASVARAARDAPRAARTAPRPPRGKPVFNATFRGSRLSTKTWATCYPGAPQQGCTNFGNIQEQEWYQPSQVRVSGGVAHLVARRARTVGTTKTGARKVYGCRSGMITSYPSFKFRYGFVQVVANIPHAKGLWPAIWLAAANLTGRPEIDMVESWGVNIKTASYYHPPHGSDSKGFYPPAITRGWHTYTLSWTKSSLKYYVDRRLVLTVTKKLPRQAMYFIANVAEYLPAKRGYCSGQLDIRSVKIWKA
jgi:beta-glucanase (GH16 family)